MDDTIISWIVGQLGEVQITLEGIAHKVGAAQFFCIGRGVDAVFIVGNRCSDAVAVVQRAVGHEHADSRNAHHVALAHLELVLIRVLDVEVLTFIKLAFKVIGILIPVVIEFCSALTLEVDPVAVLLAEAIEIETTIESCLGSCASAVRR